MRVKELHPEEASHGDRDRAKQYPGGDGSGFARAHREPGEPQGDQAIKAEKRMLMSSQGLRVIGALVEMRSMPVAA